MKLLQSLIKFGLPLVFGVGIVWFITRHLDVKLLLQTIREGIDWRWVVISLTFAVIANIARGIRWRQQLRTLGINPSLHTMALSFFGNYGMNLVFPRLGEVWRCNFIASSHSLPFSKVAGTILSERFCDILCSASIVVLTLVIEGKVLLKFFLEDGSKAMAAEAAGGTLAPSQPDGFPAWGIMLIALVVLASLWFIFRKRIEQMPIYNRFCEMCRNVWQGITSLAALPHPASYVVWSAVIWVLYFFNTLTQFYFFDFTAHLGFTACLSVFVMGTLSQLLPIQGGLGAWQAMVIFALLQYGIDSQHAIVFSIVAWSIEQAFVLVMGLYAFIMVALAKNHRHA